MKSFKLIESDFFDDLSHSKQLWFEKRATKCFALRNIKIVVRVLKEDWIFHNLPKVLFGYPMLCHKLIFIYIQILKLVNRGKCQPEMSSKNSANNRRQNFLLQSLLNHIFVWYAIRMLFLTLHHKFYISDKWIWVIYKYNTLTLETSVFQIIFKNRIGTE